MPWLIQVDVDALGIYISFPLFTPPYLSLLLFFLLSLPYFISLGAPKWYLYLVGLWYRLVLAGRREEGGREGTRWEVRERRVLEEKERYEGARR